ncbi:hypothetical protein ABZ178_31195 [Streptomyces massasporeus]|uniref:hypothetical protein n=1 Tax=Streptomyces massasporeus TaxID=67324 RepID=UPI0033BF67F7
MLPADMTGGVSATRAADLEVRRDVLEDFVTQVDAVLRDLEKSGGNPTKVSAQTIKEASLSSGTHAFPEAQGLFTQYNRVHTELTSLSKMLHLQIEAMGIAVQGAKGTFDSLEQDQRWRFWEIQTQIKELQPSEGAKSTYDHEAGAY